MALIFDTTLNAEEFKNIVSGHEKQSTVENTQISDFTLPVEKIEGVVFKHTKWTNIDASKKLFENVRFEDCELTNLNFRDVTLINVTFNKCKLKNVVMNKSKLRNISFIDSHLISTDPNIDNNYLELDVDKIMFINTELDNIGFYKSKGAFIFDNAKLNDVSGQSLKSGSALYFNSVNAFDIDFSRSNLSALEVKSSVIKNSKANGCTIGKLLLEDSELDFPISGGNSFDTVIAKNTGNVVIAGTPTKKVQISGCPKDTRIIMVGGDTFESIEIKDCNADDIVFFESIGKYISIENADIYKLDFRLSKIDHLKLNNINIKTELYYDSSVIKKLEATNISFGDGLEHTRESSNIEINADK